MLDFNKKYALSSDEGDSRQAQNLYVIAHDTGNPNNKGANSAIKEAAYMKGHYEAAYTHFIVDDENIMQVGEPGYVTWGALNANPYSPVQIELAHVDSQERFNKSYKNYIDLIRWACDTYGISKELDVGGAGTVGVKSHLWVTENYGGDHTDPYGYLASFGISQEQFANDIANGIDGKATIETRVKITPQPEKSFEQSFNSDSIDGLNVNQETGTFYPDSTINVRTQPTINAEITGQLNDGDSITYYGYVLADGYVWVAYKNYNGDDRYCAVREQGNHIWGTIE